MSSSTPNGNDCIDQEVAAVAAAAAGKNAFLELQQQAANLHGSMVHHAAHSMPHMTGAYQIRSPYQQSVMQHAQHADSAAAAAAFAGARQLGAYPFSHMAPQNSYTSGYHHLSPYPAQCPSPARDGS